MIPLVITEPRYNRHYDSFIISTAKVVVNMATSSEVIDYKFVILKTISLQLCQI